MHSNAQASSYFIAEARRPCWECGALLRVFALALPPGHEEWNGSWCVCDAPVILSFVQQVSIPAREKLAVVLPCYRYAYSGILGMSYFMNHCPVCGATQRDYFLHHDDDPPGAVFMPMNQEAAARITLYPVDQPIQAHAKDGRDIDFFEAMRRSRLPASLNEPKIAG